MKKKEHKSSLVFTFQIKQNQVLHSLSENGNFFRNTNDFIASLLKLKSQTILQRISFYFLFFFWLFVNFQLFTVCIVMQCNIIALNTFACTKQIYFHSFVLRYAEILFNLLVDLTSNQQNAIGKEEELKNFQFCTQKLNIEKNIVTDKQKEKNNSKETIIRKEKIVHHSRNHENVQ